MIDATPIIQRNVSKYALPQQIQVAVRQRPTKHPNKSIYCTDNKVVIHGAQDDQEQTHLDNSFEFHRVFGSRDKNQQILEYVSPMVYQFTDHKPAIILGYGAPSSGVSWTLGTNPTSNGIIPSIFRYLQATGLEFQISYTHVPHGGSASCGEHISTTAHDRSESSGQYLQNTKYVITERQELKYLLECASTISEHLVIWFSITSHSTKLAIVDLKGYSKELFSCLSNYPTINEHDSLTRSLQSLLADNACITLLTCISEDHNLAETARTLQQAVNVSNPTSSILHQGVPPVFNITSLVSSSSSSPPLSFQQLIYNSPDPDIGIASTLAGDKTAPHPAGWHHAPADVILSGRACSYERHMHPSSDDESEEYFETIKQYKGSDIYLYL